MKKLIYLFTFIFFFLLLFSSCFKGEDCFKYELTPAEKIFIPYNVGDKAVFRNDITGEYDTLVIEKKGEYPGSSPSECSQSKGRMEVKFQFSKIASGYIEVNHIGPEGISYYSGSNDFFILEESSLQTLTVNNITFNDVYVTSIDSNEINTSHIAVIPWKIDYSKSRGFVRFHLRNNVSWSKL